jgi:polyhydroxybutyrate depolymerase
MNRRSMRMVATLVVAMLGAACGLPSPAPAPAHPPAGVTGPSAGCGVTTRGPVTDQPESIAVDGVSRDYTLTIPPKHRPGSTTPVPLVLDFHGLIEGAVRTHPFATQFSAEASTAGFVVADPIGSGGGVYWDVSLQESNPDLRFVDALVSRIESTMCVDRSSVYVTGLSYGAFMTSMLMCMRPNTFAAAAPVAGILNLCSSSERDVPFVTFHGTSDPILPYALFADTPQAIATEHRCVGPTATTMQPAIDPSTGGAITRFAWSCPGGGTDAVFYRIGGGGHSWPGSVFFSWIGFIVGPTASTIDATSIIWDFFATHHL